MQKTLKQKQSTQIINSILSIALITILVFLGYKVINQNKYELFSSDNVTRFITLTGENGKGHIEFNVNRFTRDALPDSLHFNHEFYESVVCEFDKNDNLSNGDHVKLTCVFDKDIAKEAGLDIVDNVLDITVNGLK